MNETSTKSSSESVSTQARIDVDPLRVVVAATYLDGSLEVVHGRLADDLTLTLPGGDDAVVRMATDGVVLVAEERVLLVAFGVDHQQGGHGPAPAMIGSIELIGHAQEALAAAANALRFVEGVGPT